MDLTLSSQPQILAARSCLARAEQGAFAGTPEMRLPPCAPGDGAEVSPPGAAPPWHMSGEEGIPDLPIPSPHARALWLMPCGRCDGFCPPRWS